MANFNTQNWLSSLGIGSLRQSLFPTYLGVDIGTTSIKVVEVKQGKQLPQVVNYGFSEESRYLGRPSNAIQTSALKIFDQEASEILMAIIRKMKPSTKEVIASLPSFSAFMTVLSFPEMTASELGKSITYQAKQYIPLPLSEVAMEWVKVGEYVDEQGFKVQQVLLISVPQENIKKYQQIFKTAGLNLHWLELESMSVGRVLIGGDPTPTIVIDIGSRSTNIAFFEKGQLRFNAQSDFGGAAVTQALTTSLNINPRRAEELKRERGIIGGGAEHELSTIMTPFLDAIINDVKKAQFNYNNQFVEALRPERVIMSGGGSNLLGADRYFERELGVTTVKATPFVRFEYPTVIEPLVPQLNTLLSVALGLGMREFVSQ
ncbi:MAG: type IV pilus assembly protein PilM [Anaplasmataceae bacterium]|nr:type IV pilus assembly protein PilM [Anaplasmataceae bacterium]